MPYRIARIESYFIHLLETLLETPKSVKRIATLLTTLHSILHNIIHSEIASLRGLYYRHVTLFSNQGESDRAIATISRELRMTRRELGISSCPKALIIGAIKISIGDEALMSCMTTLQPYGCSITSFGAIKVKLESRDLRYILVVEKETIYYRLLQCDLVKRLDIATRELLYEVRNHCKKLDTPILCLTDCNRAGLNIALTFYRGPIKTNYYVNECSIPELKWIYLGKLEHWESETQSIYEMHNWREILALMKSGTYNIDEIVDLDDRLIKILEKL